MSLKLGEKLEAPSFSLTENKNIHSFNDFLGKVLVLYFYPKDSTPGCTLEAWGFRDHLAEFSAANAVILGVSKDSSASHEKFRAKHSLPFDLIVDSEAALCNYFGVLKQKSMFGRKYLGIERSTFVINAEGVLVQEWRKVSVTGHVKSVLEFVQGVS